jgi:hypothetical protein
MILIISIAISPLYFKLIMDGLCFLDVKRQTVQAQKFLSEDLCRPARIKVNISYLAKGLCKMWYVSFINTYLIWSFPPSPFMNCYYIFIFFWLICRILRICFVICCWRVLRFQYTLVGKEVGTAHTGCQVNIFCVFFLMIPLELKGLVLG